MKNLFLLILVKIFFGLGIGLVLNIVILLSFLKLMYIFFELFDFFVMIIEFVYGDFEDFIIFILIIFFILFWIVLCRVNGIWYGLFWIGFVVVKWILCWVRFVWLGILDRIFWKFRRSLWILFFCGFDRLLLMFIFWYVFVVIDGGDFSGKLFLKFLFFVDFFLMIVYELMIVGGFFFRYFFKRLVWKVFVLFCIFIL